MTKPSRSNAVRSASLTRWASRARRDVASVCASWTRPACSPSSLSRRLPRIGLSPNDLAPVASWPSQTGSIAARRAWDGISFWSNDSGDGGCGTRPLPGRAWMGRAQGGDRAGYHRLLTEITPYVRSIAARYHRTREDVEDAVQDVLLSVHTIRHTYDPGRPFGPWLATIADRRALDRLRKRLRTARPGTPPGPAPRSVFGPPGEKHSGGPAARESGAWLGTP